MTDAWSQLTETERVLLTGKLREADGQTSQQVFNYLVSAMSQGDESKVEFVVAGFKNLLDNTGAHSQSAVWRQIKYIDGGWLGKNESMNIVISVAERSDFLQVLSQNGYEVDQYYERVNLTGGHRHSARFITETSSHAGLHFVQQKGYAEERFDLHWDRRSVAFRNMKWKYPLSILARAIERGIAGLSHHDPPSSIETRQQLKKMKVVEAYQSGD